MTAPLCFSSPRVFELWLRADMSLPLANRCENFCTDCLPSYKVQMKREGRCEHPETVFDIEREGGLFGRCPS